MFQARLCDESIPVTATVPAAQLASHRQPRCLRRQPSPAPPTPGAMLSWAKR